MGFRYRKSINLGGGFRINLSKSGVGYSWGTKGFRIGKTATGKTRKTYSIPGTGISYVSESGAARNRNGNSNRQSQRLNPVGNSEQRQPLNPSQSYFDPQRSIETETIDNFQSAEFRDITKAIEHTISLNRWGTILLFGIVLAFAHVSLLILPVLGITLKIIAHTSGATRLEYDFDSEQKEEYERRIGAWGILAEGDKEWQVLTETYNSNTKVNAGATRSLNRGECKIANGLPFYVKSNVEAIQIKLKKETLLVLPDKVFIVKGTKVGAENYNNVRIRTSSTRFVESEAVPKDAQVVGQTWQYVNKNGTPDQRYKNNRQFPICNYGVVHIESPSGINVEIQVSNVQKCKDFDVLIR